MNIQQRRLEKGWTQEDLARHSGLSTRTIQRIESGHSVGLESLKCIAAVFEVSTDSLLQEKSMNKRENREPSKFLQKEQEAIDSAQLIFKGPKKGQNDPLMEVERKAINQVRTFFKKS